MAQYVFAPPPQPAVAVKGDERLFPVARIFCVGRNYADHAREMGFEVDREAPFYFLKPSLSLTPSGAMVPYPAGTSNLHHEMELVVALSKGGSGIAEHEAADHVFGYGCGLDMTRRDLQIAARDKGRPWDLGKSFEHAAILAPLTPAPVLGALTGRNIALTVNGTVRQQATLDDLVWSVPEIIAHLSRYYTLRPGDLIFTGTPAGVGPVVPGDRLEGTIDGLEPVRLTIAEPT